MTEAAQSPRLLERVREVMHLEHLSLKTAKSYLYYMPKAIAFQWGVHSQTSPIVLRLTVINSL
jgi:hypothetical protein